MTIIFFVHGAMSRCNFILHVKISTSLPSAVYSTVPPFPQWGALLCHLLTHLISAPGSPPCDC